MPSEDLKQKIDAAREGYLKELEVARSEARELDVLVRQATTEVDRQTQRVLQLNNRMRDFDVNLERYSKEDIRNFYNSKQEAEMRLQATRAQIDLLEKRKELVASRINTLTNVINILDEVSKLSDGMVQMSSAPSSEDDLVTHIIQSHEDERLRMSLQMHDGPAQSMSNLVLRAEICQRLIDRDIDMARSEINSLKTAINTTLQDTRRLIFDLRPMTLDDLGLEPTLRRYISQIGEKNNIEVSLSTGALTSRLPSLYEVTLFRFVQEALNNVIRHANAHKVRISFDVDSNQSALQITVDDDGNGFNISETFANPGKRRNRGIASMRQQIEVLLRGEFGIESAISRGTRVAATVPLP